MRSRLQPCGQDTDGERTDDRGFTARGRSASRSSRLQPRCSCSRRSPPPPAPRSSTTDNPPAAGEAEAFDFGADRHRRARHPRPPRRCRPARPAGERSPPSSTAPSGRQARRAPARPPRRRSRCPATLNVYAVGPTARRALLLASQTKTFQLACEEGPQSLAFELPGVTLPPEAILAVSFAPTSGYAPTGLAGPADAVAVVLAGPAAVGANPREAEGAYRADRRRNREAAPVFGVRGAAPQLGRDAGRRLRSKPPAAPARRRRRRRPRRRSHGGTPPPPRREFTIPGGKRISPQLHPRQHRADHPARGRWSRVRCTGSSAAACSAPLSLKRRRRGSQDALPRRQRKRAVVVDQPLGSASSSCSNGPNREAARIAADPRALYQAGGAAVKEPSATLEARMGRGRYPSGPGGPRALRPRGFLL